MSKKKLFEIADDLIIDLYVFLQNVTADLDDDDEKDSDFVKLRKCQEYLSGRGIELE